MALDPRISLATKTVAPIDVAAQFGKTLSNLRAIDLLNQNRENIPLQNQLLQLQTELEQAQQPARLQQAERAGSGLTQQLQTQQQIQQFDLGNAKSLSNALASNDLNMVNNELTRQEQVISELVRNGQLDESEILEVQQAIQLANQPGGLQTLKQVTDSFLQQVTGRKAATKSFAPITDPETGQVSLPTFNPNTGEAELVPVEGATQLTPTQKQQQELKQFTTKERRKARISRAKEIKKEIGDRNRSAARSQQPLFEALRLASNPRTAEGLAAGIQTQLARVLPGINVANEGNLDSALNRLALEQLQNFKGPTTDFEFGVTQNITGSLTDPRKANVARLKSLQRANWFAKREFKQFNEFVDSGGDPDNFAFDFNETIETKKGEFNLKDIQDTAVDNNLTIEEVIERLNR